MGKPKNRPKGRPSAAKSRVQAAPGPPVKAAPKPEPAAAQPASKPAPKPAPRPAPGPAAPPPSAAASWVTAWPLWRVGLTVAVLFVLGGAVGLAGSFLHIGIVSAGIDWPVGLVFALLCAAALGTAGGMYVRSRAGAVIAAIGWTVAVVWTTSPRPEGDLVVGGGASGLGFMLGGLATHLAVIMFVPYAQWAGADRFGRP